MGGTSAQYWEALVSHGRCLPGPYPHHIMGDAWEALRSSGIPWEVYDSAGLMTMAFHGRSAGLCWEAVASHGRCLAVHLL